MEHQAFYEAEMSGDNWFVHHPEVTRYILDKEAEARIKYAPNGSNYHDHLCNCPGCNYDGPEPTEAEIQEMEAAMQEQEWEALQAVPSYVERYSKESRVS